MMRTGLTGHAWALACHGISKAHAAKAWTSMVMRFIIPPSDLRAAHLCVRLRPVEQELGSEPDTTDFRRRANHAHPQFGRSEGRGQQIIAKASATEGQGSSASRDGQSCRRHPAHNYL